MEEKMLDICLEKLEERAKAVLLLMDAFHKRWYHLMYEDYTLKNFQVFGERDTLHISIYNDWKYKSDTILKILRNLKSISGELKIAMALKAFDRNVIEEVNLEVLEFSKAVESFEVDKYAIEFLVAQYKEEIYAKAQMQIQKEKLSIIQKEDPRVAMPNSPYAFSSFVKRGVDSIYNIVLPTPAHANTRTTKGPDNQQKSFDELVYALTELSTLAITMNSDLKSFGFIISAAIQNIKINNVEATDSENDIMVQVLALEKITHKLQYLFKSMQYKAFKNEEITRVLVLESNPRFLISQ